MRLAWVSPGDVYIAPQTRIVNYNWLNPSQPFEPADSQEFIQYGNARQRERIVLLHARATDKCNSSYRNWPLHMWVDLGRILEADGYTVISTGVKVEHGMYLTQRTA